MQVMKESDEENEKEEYQYSQDRKSNGVAKREYVVISPT